MVSMDQLSKEQLDILELFAKTYEEEPQALKETLLNVPLSYRCGTLAFIQSTVPKLYENINKLLQEK